MLSGIPDDMLHELRDEYPRTRIAEFIGRIAAFPRECFAGVRYLAREVGVSKRTGFRYMRRLKDDGLLERIPGSRRLDQMPLDAERPGALKQHGFATTRFRGPLAQRVHQGRSIVASRMTRKQVAKTRRELERRERRAAEALVHEQRMAEQYPEPTRPPRTPKPMKRAPVSDAEREHWARKYPEPPRPDYEGLALELELSGGATYELGPPD